MVAPHFPAAPRYGELAQICEGARLVPGRLPTAKPATSDVVGLLDLGFDSVLPGQRAAVLGGAKDEHRPAFERARATLG